MRFAAIGIATAVAYALWVVWLPLLPANLYVPLLDLGKITGYTWQAALTYLGFVIALHGLYALGYRLVSKGVVPTLPVSVFGAVFAIELLGAYPATAVDVFGYIAHGRMLADHHVNPFITPPNAFPTDAILAYLAFPSEPSQYGPAWVLLDGALALAARGELLGELILYKLVAAVAHLVGGLLVLGICRQLGARPSQARAGAFLFVWNPLLLWEMVGNAHNDGLMMVGGLLAVLLLLRRSYVVSLSALVAGALVKVPVIVIGPLLLVTLARRRLVAALEGVALAMLLAFVVYRPFWDGPGTLTALRRTELFTASFGAVLRLGLEAPFGLPIATDVARGASLTLFALVVALCIGLAVRAQTSSEIVTLAYATMLAAMLLATTWFQAWYVVWPFAFAAALPDGRRHLEAALLSLGGWLQYFVFIYLWVIGVFPPYESFDLQVVAYAALVGPLVLGALAMRWPRWTRVSLSPKEMVDAN
ncbi:MAG TPA: hypothetical protein VFG86_20410 [Chloroflexota bacterium]|jgi:hypothetical protein|nr:hypothetical protein [Chloroflexota bacterium]